MFYPFSLVYGALQELLRSRKTPGYRGVSNEYVFGRVALVGNRQQGPQKLSQVKPGVVRLSI